MFSLKKKRNEPNVMQSIANSKETIKIPGIPISCVFLSLIELTMAKTELLCPKNAGAKVAMDFT